uniref:Uncharacterized protein n=1 Tax=Rhizophora mucronata TaxID=61149 RepID=A0A2P2N322_RHIMU
MSLPNLAAPQHILPSSGPFLAPECIGDLIVLANQFSHTLYHQRTHGCFF